MDPQTRAMRFPIDVYALRKYRLTTHPGNFITQIKSKVFTDKYARFEAIPENYWSEKAQENSAEGLEDTEEGNNEASPKRHFSETLTPIFTFSS